MRLIKKLKRGRQKAVTKAITKAFTTMSKEKLYSFEGKHSDPVSLYYFDIPGKAEGLRCALYYSKISFVDVR